MSFEGSHGIIIADFIHFLAQESCRLTVLRDTFALRYMEGRRVNYIRAFSPLLSPSAQRYPILTNRKILSWELTDELSGHSASNEDLSTTRETHTNSAGSPSSKISHSLASSLPFLFNSTSNRNTTGLTNEKGKKVKASDIKAVKVSPAKRSKWWAGLQKDDGKKVPIFGPERVVEDPYIQVC